MKKNFKYIFVVLCLLFISGCSGESLTIKDYFPMEQGILAKYDQGVSTYIVHSKDNIIQRLNYYSESEFYNYTEILEYKNGELILSRIYDGLIFDNLINDKDLFPYTEAGDCILKEPIKKGTTWESADPSFVWEITDVGSKPNSDENLLEVSLFETGADKSEAVEKYIYKSGVGMLENIYMAGTSFTSQTEGGEILDSSEEKNTAAVKLLSFESEVSEITARELFK